MRDDLKPYLIFDFGNILLDIDYRKTLASFNKLFEQNWQQENLPANVKQWMKILETGSIEPSRFIENFEALFDRRINQELFIQAWNALLIGIPQGRIDFIVNLKRRYNLALLSNTNAIHLEWVNDHLKSVHGLDLEAFGNICFHNVFYSHEIGLRKPDQEIYHFVQRKLNLSGDQILFIDDLAKNVDAAKECGWNAVQHDPKLAIEDKLDDYIGLWEKKVK